MPILVSKPTKLVHAKRLSVPGSRNPLGVLTRYSWYLDVPGMNGRPEVGKKEKDGQLSQGKFCLHRFLKYEFQ